MSDTSNCQINKKQKKTYHLSKLTENGLTLYES